MAETTPMSPPFVAFFERLYQSGNLYLVPGFVPQKVGQTFRASEPTPGYYVANPQPRNPYKISFQEGSRLLVPGQPYSVLYIGRCAVLYPDANHEYHVTMSDPYKFVVVERDKSKRPVYLAFLVLDSSLK